MKSICSIFLSVFFFPIVSNAGTITQSLSTLPNFGNVYPFHSSTSQRYTVSGSSLTANLVITGSNGYEVSLTYGFGYSESIIIVPISGTIASTPIFVRFSPTAIGILSGTISNVSVGSPTQNLTISGTCINWAIPTAYYTTINTQRGASLKTVLYNKISAGTISLGYTPGVWNAFNTTDVQPNGKVWDVYSTLFNQASAYEFTLVTDQDGGSGGTSEGQKYNREHSFPQSWFASASPMISDVHHVFATDKFVNSQRGDLPYGTVGTTNWTSSIGAKRGSCNFPGYTNTVFEPIDEYKGDLARAQLYIATRYENAVAGWQSNASADNVLNGTIYPAFDPWHISLLLEWNNLDPISDKEIKRNNAVFALQNNRNPFIDSPQFVQRIWGGVLPLEPTIAVSNITIINNSNNSVTLKWKSGNGVRRMVLVKTGSAVNQFPTDTVHYQANSNFSSAPQIGTGNFIAYNGTGSNVTITNLAAAVNYHYAIVEYNGWYTSSNYQNTGIATFNSTTLPVDLISFDAEKTDAGIFITWVTGSEIDNDFFTVEKSINNQRWDILRTIKGKGTTVSKTNYQLIDEQEITQATYYRLKQTDFDGKYTYSKTVSIKPTTPDLYGITIFPNPFKQEFRISFQADLTGTIKYTISNLIGDINVETHMDLQGGTNKQMDVLNLGNIPVGIYILQLEYEGKQYRYKIIKQ